ILAGATTADITVTVIDDTIVEANETVVVNLTTLTGNAGVTVGSPASATVTITDNDTATVSIAATTQAAEPSTNGHFTLTQSTPSSTNTVVTYTLDASSTARSVPSFPTRRSSDLILAGATTADITVTVIDDAIVEANETVIVNLTSLTGNPGVTV